MTASERKTAVAATLAALAAATFAGSYALISAHPLPGATASATVAAPDTQSAGGGSALLPQGSQLLPGQGQLQQAPFGSGTTIVPPTVPLMPSHTVSRAS